MKTTFVQTIVVMDPIDNVAVELEIRRLESGAMIGIDASFLEQEVGEIYSPYNKNVQLDIDDDVPLHRNKFSMNQG